jgi:hypothetical protein
MPIELFATALPLIILRCGCLSELAGNANVGSPFGRQLGSW